MNSSHQPQAPAAPAPVPATRGHGRGPLGSFAIIAVFDIAGPLIAYSVLRSAGQSPVSALVLSGILPAFGVAIGLLRSRRLDIVGGLVLTGIAVGTILGLVSGDPRLVLAEGSVPTAVFGLACLGSLWTRRPLLFRFASDFVGAGTRQGREFAARWPADAGFRRAFRLFTLVWGIAYLAEAAARVVIAETVPAGLALTVSKLMPFAVAAVLIGWTASYARRARRARAASGGPDGEPRLPSEHPLAVLAAAADRGRGVAGPRL